jgi:hypothetical protein
LRWPENYSYINKIFIFDQTKKVCAFHPKTMAATSQTFFDPIFTALGALGESIGRDHIVRFGASGLLLFTGFYGVAHILKQEAEEAKDDPRDKCRKEFVDQQHTRRKHSHEAERKELKTRRENRAKKLEEKRKATQKDEEKAKSAEQEAIKKTVNAFAEVVMSDVDDDKLTDEEFNALIKKREEELKQREAREAKEEEETLKKKDPFPLWLRKTYLFVRATIFPLATIACIWSLTYRPEWLQSVIPPIFSDYAQTATTKFVPLYARDLTEAYDLGRISYTHDQALAAGNSAGVQEALQKTSALLKNSRDNVTSEQLGALRKTLSDLDNNRGPLQRLMGLMSLTSVLQAISMLGITALAIPFITITGGKPLVRTVKWCWRNFGEAILRKTYPLIEPLVHILPIIVAVESSRYPIGDQLSYAGTLTAFGSQIVFAIAVAVSWGLADYRRQPYFGHQYNGEQNAAWMMALAAMPLAILHESKFFAYWASLLLTVAMGFTAFAGGGCLFLGFNSRNQLAKSTMGCMLISVAMACIKSLGFVDNKYLEPFQGPLTTLTTAVFFLGMIILAWAEKKHKQFITTVAGYIVVGEMLGLTGMSRAAQTWGVVYAFGQYCMLSCQANILFGAFSSFVALYFVGRFFTNHPEMITYAFWGSA